MSNANCTQFEDYLSQKLQNGIKNEKIKKALSVTSISFKHLPSKMLAPIPKDRYEIKKVASHPWVELQFNETFQKISDRWKYDAVQEIANAMGVSFDQIKTNIQQNPFGPIGGIYNIKKYKYLKNRTYRISNIKKNFFSETLENQENRFKFTVMKIFSLLYFV